jgi:hypothetical protein
MYYKHLNVCSKYKSKFVLKYNVSDVNINRLIGERIMDKLIDSLKGWTNWVIMIAIVETCFTAFFSYYNFAEKSVSVAY